MILSRNNNYYYQIAINMNDFMVIILLTNQSAIGCSVNNVYLIYIVHLHKSLDYIYYHYYVNTCIDYMLSSLHVYHSQLILILCTQCKLFSV